MFSFLFLSFLAFGWLIRCECLLEHGSCLFPHKLGQLKRLYVLCLAQNFADLFHTFVGDWIVGHIVPAKRGISSHGELHSLEDLLAVVKLTVRQGDVLEGLGSGQTLENRYDTFVDQWITLQIELKHLGTLEDQDLKQTLSTLGPDIAI